MSQWTALHFAASRGHDEICMDLLSKASEKGGDTGYEDLLFKESDAQKIALHVAGAACGFDFDMTTKHFEVRRKIKTMSALISSIGMLYLKPEHVSAHLSQYSPSSIGWGIS